MRVLLLVVGLLAGRIACAQAVVTFHFERPGVAVTSYTFTVPEAGGGTFVAVYPPLVSMTGVAATAQGPAHGPEMLAVSAGTRKALFEKVRAAELGKRDCASKAKHLADTGLKVLTYAGGEGAGTCAYNYSDDKGVAGVTQMFQAMANTYDEGRVLEFKRRFDRLGLDEVMTRLVEEVKVGQAMEMGNIAPTLRRLVDDAQVLERVRGRARKLLEGIAPE